MKAGDLVRFKVKPKSFFSRYEAWNIGLLVEYHTWEKIATILHEGEVLRIRAENVQKAGKKDIEQFNNPD
tara:strand:+ start:2443 stop:2652 length:210 start_codon:yes stop_codon:yes gene_type:complete